MSTLRDKSRPLWLSVLLSQLALLIGLSVWLAGQMRPVYMHDLQLSAGEKLKCVSYAPYHHPGTLAVAGYSAVPGGDNRFFNNVFVGGAPML